ncbi:MAG: 4-(cytidine 5'-diphospho)-2-C-methyl-D-erythritol kinase [Clostridia bacterium]|nr:4-(cytidine 5'-diphospho)-2-C-methyl-D-erythritol kinase [Clostridia bacterium]
MSITLRAPAKLNLALDITGRRSDGYHTLRTVMQTIDWYDTVTVDLAEDEAIHLSCDGGIPADEHNIAYRAAALFRERTGMRRGVHITVEKHIPSQAGMAGGSADGAAVLRALNELADTPLPQEELLALGAKLGADVPFCLMGGTMLATGIGTDLAALPPLPACCFVVVKPEGGVSTPEAYRLLDSAPTLLHPDVTALCTAIEQGDLNGVIACMGNSFEQPLALPHTASVVTLLKQHGAAAALLTGSGSAVFGLFRDASTAEAALAALQQRYPNARLCHPV